MQRRSLLRLGLLASVTLGLAGAGVACGRRAGDRAASAPPHAPCGGPAQAVLADLLPTDAAAREAALDQHLERLQATVAGLPLPRGASSANCWPCSTWPPAAWP
jgi:hypothetical protein